MSNINHWEVTKQPEVKAELKRKKKWQWPWHTLRREPSNITRKSLTWNLQDKRTKGRAKVTWIRELETEMKAVGKTWGSLAVMTGDRQVDNRSLKAFAPQRVEEVERKKNVMWHILKMVMINNNTEPCVLTIIWVSRWLHNTEQTLTFHKDIEKSRPTFTVS